MGLAHRWLNGSQQVGDEKKPQTAQVFICICMFVVGHCFFFGGGGRYIELYLET